ncbi:MAG: hypothetical protein RLZZ591_1117 [Pseudomonadota bacterium]
MADIVQIALTRIGPCVSTALVKALVDEYRLTPANARQKVSRSTSIKKLAYLPFPRNARFVYLQSDYASHEFWHALTDELLRNSISYGGGLAALLARGGVMPVEHFAIACGAPLAQKGHQSPATILSRLEKADLVKVFDVPGIGKCLELSQKAAAQSFELAQMRARLKTETILLCAIKDWARNLGLVSYNKVELRDEGDKQPKVGTFNWDMTGPSYVGPLVQWSGSKPKSGFLVCDVLLGTNVSEKELQPFINKCKTLRSLTKVGRCMQIFVADGYTPEAFALARSNGVIPATTETLFGADVAKALRELTDLLKDVFPRVDTFEKVDAVFSRLSHIEGAATNLRGALFEYFTAELVRLNSAHTTIQLNEILRDDIGRSAEVDVLVLHIRQTVRFIECKGYKPGGIIPDDLVKHWLDDRIPVIRRAAAQEPFWNNCQQVFEFWTSGDLSPEAKQNVKDAASKTTKYTLKIVDRDAIMEALKATNSTALKKTFKEHFSEHPLEKAERASKKAGRKLPIPGASQLPKREVVGETGFTAEHPRAVGIS